MEDLSDRAHAELLNAYNVTNQDIARTKQQQWRDFYAILIADGALLGLYHAVLSDANPPFVRNLFIYSPLALLALGIVLIVTSQLILQNQRSLADAYQRLHTATIQTIWEKPFSQSKYQGFYPYGYTVFLIVATWFFTVVMCQTGR